MKGLMQETMDLRKIIKVFERSLKYINKQFDARIIAMAGIKDVAFPKAYKQYYIDVYMVKDKRKNIIMSVNETGKYVTDSDILKLKEKVQEDLLEQIFMNLADNDFMDNVIWKM